MVPVILYCIVLYCSGTIIYYAINVLDSHAALSLAKAMGHSLIASLAHQPEGRPTRDALDPQCMEWSIIDLANDIQAILGEALAAATTMVCHKTLATHSKGTLPRHL